NTAIIDGLTIAGGNDTGGGEGGGMRTHSGSPTVNNCVFTDNEADYGGAMMNAEKNKTTVTKFIFKRNQAQKKGGRQRKQDRQYANCRPLQVPEQRGKRGTSTGRCCPQRCDEPHLYELRFHR